MLFWRVLFVLVAVTCAFSRQLPAEPKRPKILGIAHIAFFAHDLKQARLFYHDLLGFDEPYALPGRHGKPGMAFFKVNDHQFIEVSPEQQPASDRLDHWAIETDNAEAMRKYLAAHSFEVPKRVPKGSTGNLNFMVKDPEGHKLEVVEYAKRSKTRQTKGRFLSSRRIAQHIRHVGIITTNLGPEMKFFVDVLGFTETWRGSSNGTTLSWINLRVPDGSDYVELMLYKESPPPTKRGSAHHLSLEVPDATERVAVLKDRTEPASYTRQIEIRTGRNRKRQVNLFDFDGTRTELMEPNTIDGQPTPPSTAPPPE